MPLCLICEPPLPKLVTQNCYILYDGVEMLVSGTNDCFWLSFKPFLFATKYTLELKTLQWVSNFFNIKFLFVKIEYEIFFMNYKTLSN